MLQLIISLNYLHTKEIIHGELSIKNIFLGNNMELKIDNFFLAKYLTKDRKNLNEINGATFDMAPEILNKEKYSFPADIWTLGIIMNQLLTGKNPFYNSKKNLFFENIIKAKVEFPKDLKISSEAKNLIEQILVKEPSKRPTLNQIIYHDFFNKGKIPKYLSAEVFDKVPEVFSDDEKLNKEVQFITLNKIIVPKIEPITYDSIGCDLSQIKTDYIKNIDIDYYILKYYDKKNEYGIGYLLNNGHVGMFFRDKTKIILNTNSNNLKYIEKDEEKFIIFNINKKQTISDDLENKINILKEFKNYFDEKVKNEKKDKEEDEKSIESNKIKEITTDGEIKDNIDKDQNKEEIEDNFIYVQNAIIDDKLIFFKLKNQTQHIIFKDKIEMIMTSDTLIYINYINKEKYIVKIMLKDVLSNPIHELKARYNYARCVYINWINKEIRKNFEKFKKEKHDINIKQIREQIEDEKEIKKMENEKGINYDDFYDNNSFITNF